VNRKIVERVDEKPWNRNLTYDRSLFYYAHLQAGSVPQKVSTKKMRSEGKYKYLWIFVTFC